MSYIENVAYTCILTLYFLTCYVTSASIYFIFVDADKTQEKKILKGKTFVEL